MKNFLEKQQKGMISTQIYPKKVNITPQILYQILKELSVFYRISSFCMKEGSISELISLKSENFSVHVWAFSIFKG